MSYTPGPWHPTLAFGLPRICADSRVIADLNIQEGIGALMGKDKNGVYKNPSLRDEIIANANLLAAAPELLEACKHMLDFCPSGLMRDLRAAIAKAEGVDPANGALTSSQTTAEAKS